MVGAAQLHAAAQLSRPRRPGRIVEWRPRQDCGLAGGASRAPHTRTQTRYLVEIRGISMERLRAVEREGLKTDIPAFEGICIARRGGGINETFTVRKISAGVGVERIFPLHAPLIAEIGLLRKGRVRRAKLYFLRRLAGKAARIREKRGLAVPTGGAAEQEPTQK